MNGFQIWFIVFIAVVFIVGIYSSRKVKDADGYATANSKLGFTTIFGNTVAYCIGSYALLTNSSMGFAQGASFIFAPVAFYLFVALTPILFAKTIKNSNISTIPQLFSIRFDKQVALYVVLVAGIFNIFTLVIVQILGLSSAITTFFDIDINLAKIIAFILCVGLTLLGGMVSVSWTNVLQVGLIIVGVIAMGLIALNQVGGLEELLLTLPPEKADPFSTTPLEFISLMLISGPAVLCNQVVWQNASAAKDRKTATLGIITGAVVGLIVSLFVVLLGMAGIALLPASTAPDQVYPSLISVLFTPATGGFFIIVLLAAILSSSTSLILGLSAIIGNNVYKSYLKPNADSKHMLKIYRLLAIVIGLAALGIALTISDGIWSIYSLITPFATVSTVFPSIAAIFWKRTTKKGVLCAMTLAIAASFVWEILGNPFGIDMIIVGMFVSAVTVVVVSLLTQHSQGENVNVYNTSKGTS